MDTGVKATFATRREAELAVEHLVQEHGLNRTDIFVEPEGAANSSGTVQAGADEAGSLSEPRDGSRAKLEGAINVSVGCDDAQANVVRKALRDAGGSAIQ